jgi:hypothetical protein
MTTRRISWVKYTSKVNEESTLGRLFDNRDPMNEIRYLGFDQLQGARAYRFGLAAKGRAVRQLIVTVDLSLFLIHHVGIQEGPNLCAKKLAADLESNVEGTHELTADDFRAYTQKREAEEARKVELRQEGIRRSKARSAALQSSWHKNQP